jgi:hypothetical protein|tara:strand:- start:45557 stop:45808 length:252 start_codon:yes stop_codon:yes gene_type:complete
MEMPDFCPDFVEPAETIKLTAENLAAIRGVQKRMGHAEWLETVKRAIGLYDYVTAKNMGPGPLHLGVMAIDGSPSEVVVIDLS